MSEDKCDDNSTQSESNDDYVSSSLNNNNNNTNKKQEINDKNSNKTSKNDMKFKLIKEKSDSNQSNSKQESSNDQFNNASNTNKSSLLKKCASNNSISNDKTKKTVRIDSSAPDTLYDETLDGFSINEDNTILSTTASVDGGDDDSNTLFKTCNPDNNDTTTTQNTTTDGGGVTTKVKRRRRCSAFDVDRSIGCSINASQLYVYKWPDDDPLGELYMLQEQVCDYLDVKSFKRKYPDIYRRPINDIKEREYLKENKVASETKFDLGLTAIKLSEVLFIMSQEYPDKHKEFNDYLNEKRKTLNSNNNNSNNQKRKSEVVRTNKSVDGDKLKEQLKKAMKSASSYNSQLQRDRKEERCSMLDLQTMIMQVPKNKTFQLSKEYTNPGSYPVPLLHGQYQNDYKKYTSEELKYFPLNTILYATPMPEVIMYNDWKHRSMMNQFDLNKDSSDEDDAFDNTTANPANETVKPVVLKVEPIVKTCYVCEKSSSVDQMIHCSSCPRYSHPNCLELNPKLVDWNSIRNYNWQCMECKICSQCNKAHDEEKMMFCDRCDRGFHTYCVGVRDVPSGSWFCLTCKKNDPSLINLSTPATTGRASGTPMKGKMNSTVGSTPIGSPSQIKRGRPLGSLNKPKVGKDEIKENAADQTPSKKGNRGRPRKLLSTSENPKDELMDFDESQNTN